MVLRTCDRELQQLLEHRAGRESGQLVVIGEERDLLVPVLHLGDVEHHPERERGDAARVPDDPGLVTDPRDPPVLAIDPVVE